MEHKDTELYFLREQSSQSKSLALWSLPSLYIYFSVSLCLCVQSTKKGNPFARAALLNNH